jgi:Sec7 domain
MTPFSSPAGTPAPSEVSLRESSSMHEVAKNQRETWRPVPPHLKELCAQALMGAMKCLFRDDKASKETLLQRSQRELTIMLSGAQLQHDGSTSESAKEAKANQKTEDNNDHFLRNIKSKKRLMRKGAMLFNQKASRGIEFLVSAGLFENPPTPASVATFLRNGLVVGLNKHEVGAYLGEAGKRRESGKSPPDWERDWFHKEVLETYCKLFRFEGQSLLDGLRMFLSSFRLPGEAQQIDRILQAFADTCGAVCEESTAGRLKLFSTDPKRASDGAYLLSFSIIMLNTDLHNQNIREDRKMKLEDFIKNNTNYGSDITDKGKEFPREFLEGIYESIKEEEIRTEGEGADGCMTIERWKDVLRGSTEASEDDSTPTRHDAEDLTELVLEHVWIPIMSAIGAFWGIARSEDAMFDSNAPATHAADGALKGNMLGVQGARLGMDMAVEMLEGVLHLRRIDIFRRIFACVCKYTGLIGEYAATEDERANEFVNSLEAQSGLIVAIRVARTACDDIGVDGWKLVWQMMFELRDLKMLGSGGDGEEFGRENILKESEPDLLTIEARRLWNMWLLRGDVSTRRPQRESSGVGSVFGVFGRVLFGSDDGMQDQESGDEGILAAYSDIASPHGKEALLIWDEDSPAVNQTTPKMNSDGNHESKTHIPRSIGAQFEHDLIKENLMLSQLTSMPITGLESLEETRSRHLSPRSRVRNRVARSCDFYGLISDSRFMTVNGIRSMLKALTDVIHSQLRPDKTSPNGIPAPPSTAEEVLDLRLPVPPTGIFPLSPASLTFAEVLMCEISLKNKDRLGSLWNGLLETHYKKRLAGIGKAVQDRAEARSLMIKLGLEKCVTGLLRLSACVTNKSFADEIIGVWSQLIPPPNELPELSLLGTLDKQVSAGVWRIINNVDGFSKIGRPGWEGLFALMSWCAARGGQLPPLETDDLTSSANLAEDDPALQSYRSLHLMLNTEEVRNAVPFQIVAVLREVICTGERRNCSQLSIAGLDVLHNFLKQRGSQVLKQEVADDTFWSKCWRPSLEAMAYTAEIGVGSVGALVLFRVAGKQRQTNF